MLDLNTVEQAIVTHKISILQYRHKTTDASIKLNEAKQLQQLCLRHNTLFIINDDINLAQKIGSDGVDMDMRKEILQLLGKVKILQNSGSKINTKDLIVDQSGENEIYRTKERIHYQSKVANIYATGMRYDAKNQKIKLTGGVVGRYE